MGTKRVLPKVTVRTGKPVPKTEVAVVTPTVVMDSVNLFPSHLDVLFVVKHDEQAGTWSVPQEMLRGYQTAMDNLVRAQQAILDYCDATKQGVPYPFTGCDPLDTRNATPGTEIATTPVMMPGLRMQDVVDEAELEATRQAANAQIIAVHSIPPAAVGPPPDVVVYTDPATGTAYNLDPRDITLVHTTPLVPQEEDDEPDEPPPPPPMVQVTNNNAPGALEDTVDSNGASTKYRSLGLLDDEPT